MSDQQWGDDVFVAIMESAERQTRLHKMTNQEIAAALQLLWREIPLMTWQSDLIDEVADRIGVWNAEPDEIRVKIEAEIDEAAEGFDVENTLNFIRENNHD